MPGKKCNTHVNNHAEAREQGPPSEVQGDPTVEAQVCQEVCNEEIWQEEVQGPVRRARGGDAIILPRSC